MVGFLYEADGARSSIDLDGIAAIGLGYAFENAPECSECLRESPLGGRGLIFADSKRTGGKRTGWYPEQQTWRELPEIDGQPRRAIGYWNEAKPTPADLARSTMLPGLLVRLADEQMWQVPTVREYDEGSNEWRCELPCLFDYNGKGELVRGLPLPAHKHLWDVTAPVASILFGAGDDATSVTDQQMCDVAVALLQANYVISLPELVVLGALSDNGLLAFIVHAATNRPQLLSWIEELQKKSNDPSTATG